MTTTAHEDQFNVAPEPVRQPYDTGSILLRNVADLEIALRKQTERAEAAEAELLAVREDNHSMMVEIDGLRKELASLRWQEPVATLLLSYDGADFEMYYDNNKLRFEGMSMKLYAAAGAAPAALEMLRNILNTADAKRIFDRLSDGQGIGTDDGLTWLSARDLLQSRAVKDSLTSQADCRACVNRGRVNGLSQESFCDSCIWQGMSWRKDHHAPAVPDANPAQWLADEGDMILVPRGLLGAACSSIDKQRPAPKVLEALRYYTMNAPQAPAVPEFCAVEAQLTLAETEMLNAKAWSAGTQAKRHIDFAITAIGCARAMLQTAEVTK